MNALEKWWQGPAGAFVREGMKKYGYGARFIAADGVQEQASSGSGRSVWSISPTGSVAPISHSELRIGKRPCFRNRYHIKYCETLHLFRMIEREAIRNATATVVSD